MLEELQMPEHADFDRQLKMNRQAYQSLREEITTKYRGQYVGIAFGKIVAVDPDYHAVCRVVDCLQPPSDHHLVFRGDDEPGFEPVECFSQGNLLPCDEPAGAPPPTDLTTFHRTDV
jgi:hypothetical protein